MKNKPQKGTYGYLLKQRKRVLIKTIIFFSISLLVFLAGYITTGSNQNYLTIVAVLGCLPASKSAVNTIMLYRYHGCSAADQKRIRSHIGDLNELYDLVFTSYEKNFEIHHMALKNSVLIGYSANEKCDAAACEKHLRLILAQNGLKVSVKIFKDPGKYTNRLDQLVSADMQADRGSQAEENTQANNSQYEEQILHVLCAISL